MGIKPLLGYQDDHFVYEYLGSRYDVIKKVHDSLALLEAFDTDIVDEIDADRIAAENAASAAAISANTAGIKATDASSAAIAASTSASNASTSASTAAIQAGVATAQAGLADDARIAAEAAENLAEAWASNPYNVLVAAGKYSALHWATVAMNEAAAFTPASQLADLLTVDGTGSGLDADLLDGQHGSYFQPVLVSGTNIKTVNGVSVLGSGDLTIDGGVTSVNGYTGVVVLTKADIALGNVDNTSDADKPISTATQTALNAKQDIAANLDLKQNYIIDGDFNIWLEATSQTASGYGSDTMNWNGSGGTTKIHSRQAFTLGQTDVPGGLKYYSRTAVTSVAGAGYYCNKGFKVADVRRLAGKTVTLSFYAKADAAKNISFCADQMFGTGGTPSSPVEGIGAQLIALTTSWQKKTITITLPSITGKTLGTAENNHTAFIFMFDAGTNFAIKSANLGQQSGTFDIARVRLVEGTVDGDGVNEDINETLQSVNRYFFTTKNSTLYAIHIEGYTISTRYIIGNFTFPARMRSIPIVSIRNPAGWLINNGSGLEIIASEISFRIGITVTTTGVAYVTAPDPSIAYIDFDARV